MIAHSTHKLLFLLAAFVSSLALGAEPAPRPAASAATNTTPAQVMLLGLFHFDNPGLDAVKYKPRDVTQPAEQAYLVALSERLARFAPTKVLLEYPATSDTVINRRYAEYVASRFELPLNEIYQLPPELPLTPAADALRRSR